MNTSIDTPPHHLRTRTAMPLAARSVCRLLQALRHGRLTLHLPDGSVQTVGAKADSKPELEASIHIHDWRVFGAALKRGDIGFAQSYIAGQWSSPDLALLLRLLVANRHALSDVIHGSWAGRLLYRLRHLLHRNTQRNSRKNIHAHYDLGNAFYALWLDGTMNYSSALFAGDMAQDMRTAQDAKVRRALRMAGVEQGSRVLEIGCGWGALAEKAIVECGASVTGVTLSDAQLEWAQQRLNKLGIGNKADLRLQDYRTINDAPFDAICSIEMLEAVGQAYWPTYFSTLARLLRKGGRACIQSIVIKDDLFAQYVKSTDFIQQYIFPGGCLPCPRALREAVHSAGLKVVDELAFGADYAETCRRWRHDFLAQRSNIMALGFDERFMRIWEFYLAYCEAGFTTGDISVVQYTLSHH